MIVTNPVPAAASKPAPAPAPAAPAPAPTGAPATTPKAPAPGEPGPADIAAAKQAMLDKLDATSAVEAIKTVDDHLSKVAALSVGGGTPEGTKGAQVASALLTDASMLLQHAHVKAMDQLRTMATELHMRLMSSASGLAFMGGQIAIAGQSKEPVKLADIVAGPVQETKAAMADVVAAIAPPAKDASASTDAPAPKDAPAPAPAAPATAPATPATAPAPAGDAPPTPAPNGNTGIVPPAVAAPKVA